MALDRQGAVVTWFVQQGETSMVGRLDQRQPATRSGRTIRRLADTACACLQQCRQSVTDAKGSSADLGYAPGRTAPYAKADRQILAWLLLDAQQAR